jgi:hypothetical protein
MRRNVLSYFWVKSAIFLTRWLEPRPIDVGKGERAGWATRLSRSRWRAARGGRTRILGAQPVGFRKGSVSPGDDHANARPQLT